MSDFTVQFIPLDQIAESAVNPWHGREDVTELADSIARRGMQQPVLLRPRGDGMLELVFGHRRCRAARQAGLTEVPARVRELSDEEALEEQLTENSHRTDVHPIDEGQLLQRLIANHGCTVESCALKLKKSRAWVYERLRLADLADGVKAAAYADQISTSVAVLLAGLPRARQLDILPVVAGTATRQGMTVKEAKGYIERSATASLSDVGWPMHATMKDDEGVLSPCDGCLYRATDGEVDRCLDLACHKRKTAAWNEVELAKLVREGATRLTDVEIDHICPNPWIRPLGGFVRVSPTDTLHDLIGTHGPYESTTYDQVDGDEDQRELAQLLAAPFYKLLRVGLDRTGEIVTLAQKDDLLSALLEAGVIQPRADRDDHEDDAAGDREDILALWRPALVTYAEQCPRDRPLWLSLAELRLAVLWSLDEQIALKLCFDLGYSPADEVDDVFAALEAWLADQSEATLAAFLMSASLWEYKDQRLDGELIGALAARFGLERPSAVQTDDDEEAA